jgi:predicted XRE-type DNA-binding protein
MKATVQHQTFYNVWDALEDDPAMAATLTMRSDLLIALHRQVTGWKVGPVQAAKRLEITQPQLKDLLRGRINAFSLDTLVELAVRANIHTRLHITMRG